MHGILVVAASSHAEKQLMWEMTTGEISTLQKTT